MSRPAPGLGKRHRSLSFPLLVVTLLCAGAVTATACLLSDPSPGTATTLGTAALVPPLLAVALCLGAARRVPTERYAWWATAVAWACNVAGDLVHAVAATADPPFPSLADAFWLAGYPALFAAPLLLLRARLARPRASTWLDGVIGALGITAVAASAFLTPTLTEPGLSISGHAAALAYPVADLLLVALVGAVLAVVGLRGDVVVAAICLVVTLKFAGDLLVAGDGGTDSFSGPVTFIWSLNACLTAAAAATTAPRRRIRTAGSRTSLGWHALLIPVLCTVVSLVVLGTQWGDRIVTVGELCALGCVLAFLARTVVSFLEGRALHDAHRQARTDELTGLPNRRALMSLLERRLCARRPTSLLLIDLDGFKAVNDGLGHAAGDELLGCLGERLRPALRPDDVLARLGGDEFAVVLRTDDAAVVTACAQRLDDLVRRPLVLAGTPVRVGASIGVATSPEHAGDASALLRCADAAMYAAKGRGGGVRWYAPTASPAPAVLPSPLPVPRCAADELRFRAVTGAGERVVAVEAQAPGGDRPAGALAGPDRLAEVLDAVSGWWPAHPAPVQLGITAADLAIARLPDVLAAGLLRAGLPPAALEVRLLPTAVALDEGATALLAALRARGLPTEADTSGGGAVALARLDDLAPDRIRLDARLARRAREAGRGALVVGHTVSLATALGIAVVVDTVDADTDAALARLGCTVLVSDGDPVSAAAIADRLGGRPATPGQAPTAEPAAQPS